MATVNGQRIVSTVSERHEDEQGFDPLAAGLLFIAALALGLAPLAMPESYRWTEHGVSESGAQGVPGAWVARSGFVAFGLAVLRLARIRSRAWGPAVAWSHRLFALAMIGVAVVSARSWDDRIPYVELEDRLHSAMATVVGFAFVLALISRIIYGRHRPIPAKLGSVTADWLALAVACAVPATMSSTVDGGTWGLWQRVMFATALGWFGVQTRTQSTTARSATPE